jgi:RimJ/RimL family protein N-acetyltransferase
MRLEPYNDADLWLTVALETDPAVMRELGGPIDRERLPEIHRRRVEDPWWFKIVAEPDAAVGAIGVWASSHGEVELWEAGWMVLPAHQGRGIAGAAVAALVDRVTADPGIPSIHAFPPVGNAPSNALCRRSGFVLLGETHVDYAGRRLHCNHWSRDTSGGA